MIKKTIGIVVALAAIAVIVLAALHRRTYTSFFLEEDDHDRYELQQPEGDSATASPRRDTLPAQDVTRMDSEVPDTLGAAGSL